MATAQNWTQLGRGNGGQVRALYLHDQNPTGGGPFNLYIGSDVAGVWKSADIASASALQLETNYQYNYISNSDIMRFTNKFYRPQRTSYTSNFLFVANYQGIHRIDLNLPDGNMLQVLDFPDSWVSDMYFCDIIGTNHAVYFTTGNTRVNDGIASNSKVNNVFDFYWGTLNQAENFINPQTLQGIKLEGMTANADVYCLKVIDNNTPQINDDNYFIGSETGLWIFTNTDAVAAELLPNKTLVKLNHLAPNPDGTSNPYQVTSITDAPTPGNYLVTISGYGIYEWNGSTWTSLGDDITLSEQSNTNTITYTGWNNVPGDAKLLNQILPVVVTNVLQGYILVNENFEMQNAPYYCGVYYCNKLNTTAWNWQSLSVTNAGNNWGWNSTLPAGNINSALLTPDNDLLIGKNGNLHITQNGDITQIANTDWEQIYTHQKNTSCNGTWQNKGFVNTVNAGLYHDGTILYGGEFDRGLMKSDVNYDFTWINKAGGNTCERLLFNSSFSGCQNNQSPSIVDCKYVAANNNKLYAAVAEGTSVNKGRGYIMEKANGVTDWTQLGSTFCGDPVKIFFDAANNPNCIVNSTNPTQQSIYVLNGNIWQLCDIYNGGGQLNDNIVDALIATEGAKEYIYFIKNGSGKGVYKVENTTTLGTFSNSIAIAPILTSRVGKQLSMMPYGSSFKVLIALKNNPNNPAANNFYESNSGLTSVTAINNCTTTNVPSDIFSSPGVDETQSGVTAIEVNNNAHAIYAATLIEDPVTHKTHSHLYRTTYNNGTGAIAPCWSEITNNLPNKAINCIYPQTILNTENIFTCIRGMGEWRNQICMTIHCSVTNPTTACNSNGSATAVVDIGTAPYTYTWSNGQANSTATGLAAGTYTVTVSGSAGACTATASFTIAGLGAICTVTNSCTSGYGTATVATTGGLAPYTYSWSTTIPQSTITATGLGAGTYTVIVTDANACSTTASCIITPSTGISSVTLDYEGITCTGNDDGYTSVTTINGGVSPYTYLWSNGVTTALNNNVPIGTYTVTVTDAAGCTLSASTSVIQTSANFTSDITPGNYFLNTNVVINTSITVDHANIGIAPGVNITVNPGGVLNIINYSKLNACGDMWQGIINNGGTVIINGSTIEDAIEAVHNQNNGILNITNNTTFTGNNTDLFLDAGSYSASKITGNTFTNAAGPLTKAPLAGIAPAHHIRLNNATNLVISGNTIADKNTFNRNLLGILAVGSSFDCFNNTFTNIGSTLYAPINVPSWTKLTTCAAINANASLTNNPTIKIGDINLTFSNTFTNCDNGIVAIASPTFSRLTLGVCFNNFDNCKTSIYTRSLNGSPIDNTLNINNNTITKTPLGGIGIRVENLRFNTIANINNNLINQSGFYDAANYGRTGIDIQNYLPTVVRLTVSNNNSRNVATSIMLRNLIGYAKCGNGGGELNVFENTIDITKPIVDIGTQLQTGINVQNCSMAQLYNNDPITYTQIPVATILDFVTGINIEGSTNITLSQNKTENCGRGFSFKGVCTATNLFCNTMTNCWHGAYLDGTGVSTSISDQGDWTGQPALDVSWGNRWNNNDPTLLLNNRVDGSGQAPIFLPRWLYNNNDPQDLKPIPSNTQFVTPTKVFHTKTDCTAPQIVSDILRERNYGRTVGDSTWSDPDSTYFEITNEDAFYDAANADTTILYQNNNKDAIYQNKFNQLNAENEGRADDAICNYVNGDIAGAASVAATIDASNWIAANKQFVLEVVLAYNNVDDILDTTIIEQLYAIAYTHPFYGGEAVYWARAFLHLDVVDEMPQMRKAHTSSVLNNQNIDSTIGKLIPNPAFDIVSFEYKHTKWDKVAIKIFDTIGNEIDRMNMVSNEIKINILHYNQSIYFIHVYKNGVEVEYHKLIVLK